MLTRRELFTAAAGAMLPHGQRPTARTCPWEQPGDPLDDYDNWERWMRRELDGIFSSNDLPEVEFDELSLTTRIALYSVMVDLLGPYPPVRPVDPSEIPF